MRGAQRAEAAEAGGLGDDALVALARRGEPAAFGEIMRRHNRRLFRAARSVLGDDAEAEDAVQEAYVRAFRGLDGFRGEAGLLTWLTRIALNEREARLGDALPSAFPFEGARCARLAEMVLARLGAPGGPARPR